MKLNVSVEIMGIPQVAGNINLISPAEASFQYCEDYIKNGFPAISVALPLRKEEFSVNTTRNFFEGLLPEGFTRRSIAGFIRADADDYLSILRVLGQECIGAIRVYEEGEEPPESEYERLDTGRIAALAAEGAVASAQIVAGTRLSLAGASGKVGLAFDGDGGWYLPKGLAPSTHIVKQSHVRLKHIVVNECLVMRTARIMGLNTSDCFIINLGSGDDSEVLLASERYDRISEKPIFSNGRFGHIERLHQEDFAQILGVNSANKYETAGGHYLRDMFSVIRRYSADPIKDSREMWQRIIFNYFAGNTDCHVKNFSMLYDRNLRTMRLAPMYDALSTRVYESTTKEFAFNIGGRYNIDEITRDDFQAAAAEVGLGVKNAMKYYDSMANEFEKALDTAEKELISEGYNTASLIADKIRSQKYNDYYRK